MIHLPFFKKKSSTELTDFDQKYKVAFDKVMSEFKIGDTCYCNGLDLLSGIFMNASVGEIKNFHEGSMECDVYLIEEQETVRVLPELVFHTKEEALKEREEYNLNRKREDARKIVDLEGTTISRYINKYGLRPSIFSFIDSSVDINNYAYLAIKVSFGNVDHFVHANFVVPNLKKENNLEVFQKQFEQYCLENAYPSDCILSVSVINVSDELEELQTLVNDLNEEEKEL